MFNNSEKAVVSTKDISGTVMSNSCSTELLKTARRELSEHFDLQLFFSKLNHLRFGI